MEDLLRLVVEEKASDLHLSVGSPPVLRIRGELVKLEVAPLDPEDTESLVRSITNDANLQRLNSEGERRFRHRFRPA